MSDERSLSELARFGMRKSPDARCGVCGTKRDQHGDKHHKFTLDDEVIEVEPGAAPRKQPPTERGQALSRDPVANLVIRLVSTLVAKGLINGDDMVEIFGGLRADHRGKPATGSVAPSNEESP